jgi:HlyD family secretion protein
MLKKARKWIVLVLVVGGVVYAVSHWREQNRQRKIAEPRFRTAAVDRGAISQVVLASGTLQPVTSVNVGVQVSGTVSARYADFNDHVKAGQIILKIDPEALQARLRQMEAQLSSSQASLLLARGTYERNENLLKQGFISVAIRDQSRREFDAAKANVEVARAQVDAARTDVSHSIVRSPIDGVVIKRNIDVGQTVAASFQTPDLFQIAGDLKKMQIYTNVSEADVGAIHAGQPVRFAVDAYPDREFDGRVRQFRLSPNATAGVVTYNIVIDVDNPDEVLKPGMTAQTRIMVASKQNVVRIPTAALRFKPDDGKKTKAGAAPEAPTTVAAKAADPNDDGVLTALRSGARIYRVYTAGLKADSEPVAHDVTVGIANTRFTEMLTGDVQAGAQVITRTIEELKGRN